MEKNKRVSKDERREAALDALKRWLRLSLRHARPRRKCHQYRRALRWAATASTEDIEARVLEMERARLGGKRKRMIK